MNYLEKRHKAGMQHLRTLDSLMDETDREVMNLTDRAFKSLCIGDEAVYNDAEFSPSPVSCRKPLAEEVPRKSQENSFLVVKKHGTHRPNGVTDTSWRVNKSSSKVSSLFAAFAAEKNGDSTKLTNGDSWDRSALLSIQKELSEFSSDYQNNLSDEHFSSVKNHLNFSEKGTGNKASKDTSSSGKSSKNKHSKSSKLRKLNSKNFFLHSEFSPFQSWVDLNKFPFGLGNLEIFTNNGPPEWYDSPLYKELTSHKLPVPGLNRGKKCDNVSYSSAQHEPKDELPRQTTQSFQTTSLQSEKHTELNKPKIQIKTHRPQALMSSSAEQRCQSEGEFFAPWRRNRSRAKSTVPAGQPLVSSPACERRKAPEEALSNEKEVRAMKEQTSSNSAPFSILQLLTPVISSRQKMTSSDAIQAVLLPTAPDLLPLCETEMCPSPEIKRESYKSMASSLLFNLKDNRKRVKARYIPPKFKGLDATDQSKSLFDETTTNAILEPPETPDAKTISPTNPEMLISPISPLQEMVHLQTSLPNGHVNGGLPDDYLALSLLQDGNGGSPNKPLKSNRRQKASYPSLHLYNKTTSVEVDSKTVDAPDTHLTTDKTIKQGQSKDHAQEDCKEQIKHCTIKPEVHLNKPDDVNSENPHIIYTETNKTAEELLVENTHTAALKENYPHTILKQKHTTKQDSLTILSGKSQDKLNTEGVSKVEQRSSVRDKECLRKEPKPKHVFSSRQNNYIKSQRYMMGDDNEEYLCNGGKIDPAGRDVSRDNNVVSRNTESINTKEGMKCEKNVAVHKEKELIQEKLDGVLSRENTTNDTEMPKDCMLPSKDELCISIEQKTKTDTFSIKGNTSSKRAMFAFKEQTSMKTSIASKESAAVAKYELATAALEEVIADREQRKKKSGALISTDRDVIKSCKRQSDGSGSVVKGDYKQERKALSQKDISGRVTKDRRSQRDISDFKPSSQIVQSMSDRETKHGQSHVAEVNLARPCKQEGAAEQSQHAAGQIKYTEKDRFGKPGQQSDTDNAKPMHRSAEFKDKEPLAKNSSLKKNSRVTNIESKLSREGEEHTIQTIRISCKPEVPPRRGKERSQSEVKEIGKKENVGGRVDISVKNEELMSREVQKFNREKRVQNIIGEECLMEREGPKDYSEKNLKQLKVSVPEVTGSAPVGESVSKKSKHEETDMGLNIKKLPDADIKPAVRNQEEAGRPCDNTHDIHTLETDVTTKPDNEIDINKMESECTSDILGEVDDKSEGKGKHKCSPSSAFEKSEAVKVECECEKKVTNETPESSESIQTNNTVMESVTVYDIFQQSEPSSPVEVKQVNQSSLFSNSSKESSFSPKTEQLLSQPENDLSSQTRNWQENLKQIVDSSSFSNPEGESGVSDRVISPPSDVAKGGWIRCLIESASSLTPPCQSNVSSPTMGKPALFKVKDNTFSASPVTKTVRPILHKTLTQPWSPRESLSESDRGEEDLFKDCVDVRSPVVLSPALPSTPVRSPQSNQSLVLLLSSPTSQVATGIQKKQRMDSLTVPEEDEWRSAVSSVSEGIESSGTSAGDTVEEAVSSTAPIQDMGESKEPSERSGSVCSDNLAQSKPPTVPPKTEKALRRAMKLTTRRIQKEEAKSKPEHTGRGSGKNGGHKPERRHHSSDRVLSNKSDHRGSAIQGRGENSSDMLVPRTLRSERHGRPHSNQESHSRGKDGSRKLQHESHGNLTSNHGEDTLKGQFDMTNANACCERPGRTSQKYLPEKMGRRAQSLDRFSCNKHEFKLLSTEGIVSRMNTETENKSDANRTIVQQNSTEQTYVSPAANLVTQSFPMSQRKVLQDPDSGQYFVVDMPLQVRTKTFFDPETGSYVQLPVQSPEGSMHQAQSKEVMNTPTFVLVHGFLPVPVSALPPRKPSGKQDSVVSPGDLEVFESIELDKHEDIFPKQKREGQPYTEPMHISQEHLPEERTDSIR